MLAREAVVKLGKLFPRWKCTEELAAMFARDFDRAMRNGLSGEQIVAIIEQHRRERKGDDPSLAQIVLRMQSAQYSREVDRQAERRQEVRTAADEQVTPIEAMLSRYAGPDGERRWRQDGWPAGGYSAFLRVKARADAGEKVTRTALLREAMRDTKGEGR